MVYEHALSHGGLLGDTISNMDYEDEFKQIQKIEEETLARLSKLRIKKDAIVSNYIASLRERKIKELRKSI